MVMDLATLRDAAPDVSKGRDPLVEQGVAGAVAQLKILGKETA